MRHEKLLVAWAETWSRATKQKTAHRNSMGRFAQLLLLSGDLACVLPSWREMLLCASRTQTTTTCTDASVQRLVKHRLS
jgi:hypothetical protein